jgi:hypothetical protein
MRRSIILCVFILFGIQLLARNEKDEQLVKKGWSFGALPTITFDTDLGFQYGALVNLYNYGDGSHYPGYNHSLYFEASHYTKGSGIYRFYYDSDQLIKGLQTSMDISYLPDQAYDFYGFNGYESKYNADWADDEQPDDVYKTRMFYKYQRKLFRWKIDLQGKLSGDNKLRWISGFNFLNFNISSVDLDKLNKGKDSDELLPDVDGLFEKYQQWGAISAEEANGGFVPTFKAGLVFDTRDNKPNPMKGIWTEAVIVLSPEILGAESSFSKLSLTHRQYFTLIPDDLSFAYRLNYQTTLSGDVPFYYQYQVITSIMKGATSEGLGGAKTLRGIIRNRVVGDGYFLGNAEIRWKFTRFQFINNNFYLGLNTFADVGKVTEKIGALDQLRVMSSIPQEDYFDWDAEKLHTSYGLGLRIAMNENFIIAIDYGLAANKQDGDSGFYMGLNYLF